MEQRLLRVEAAAVAPEEASALAQASPVELALTGMLFGLIHVLTGPDHLSALATLSAGSSWRSFALGIRWGCGHSIGLIVMAVVFIALDGKLDFSVLNEVTDILVGVFMVALGVYGIHEGVSKFRANARGRVAAALKKKQSDSELRAKRLAANDMEAGHIQGPGEDDGDETERTETDSQESDGSPQQLLRKGERSSSYHEASDHEEDTEGDLSPHSRRRRRLEGRSPTAADDKREHKEEANDDDDQPARFATNMDALAVEDSPTESVVALQGLLSNRSTSSEHDIEASDALPLSPAARLAAKEKERGPVCCGFKLPSIDFRNAQTQKVRLTSRGDGMEGTGLTPRCCCVNSALRCWWASCTASRGPAASWEFCRPSACTTRASRSRTSAPSVRRPSRRWASSRQRTARRRAGWASARSCWRSASRCSRPCCRSSWAFCGWCWPRSAS